VAYTQLKGQGTVKGSGEHDNECTSGFWHDENDFSDYVMTVTFSYKTPWCLVARLPGLQTHRSQVRFPALPDVLSSSESGTGSIQPLCG
jgi:hypothetical protein